VISELRRYRIDPARVDSFLEFLTEAARRHEDFGIRVEYMGVDRETGTFVWVRSFEDEADRASRKEAYYGSSWFLERESFAMGHVLEYVVTFLDATLVRDGGPLRTVAFQEGERPGSRGDSPPTGWDASTRRTYVPSRPG
jgi:hypothetical protein